MKGLNVQSCVSCGAYTLDQLTLERLLGGPTSHWGATPDPNSYRETPGSPPVYHGAPTVPAPPPPPPALPGELPPELPSQQRPTFKPEAPAAARPALRPAPSKAASPATPGPRAPASPFPEADYLATRAAAQRRTAAALALVVLALAGFGAMGAGFLVWGSLAGGPHVVDPMGPPADLDDVLADRDEEGTEGPATAKVTSEPPDPEPAPPPEPADSVGSLVSQGWNLVGRDLQGAAELFRKALAIRAADAEANYGYGYVLLKQGNTSGARPYLCRALVDASVETRRDVTALLAQHHLTCS